MLKRKDVERVLSALENGYAQASMNARYADMAIIRSVITLVKDELAKDDKRIAELPELWELYG